MLVGRLYVSVNVSGKIEYVFQRMREYCMFLSVSVIILYVLVTVSWKIVCLFVNVSGKIVCVCQCQWADCLCSSVSVGILYVVVSDSGMIFCVCPC